MVQIGESDENFRLARSQTDPLWLQDHFLGTGHDADTRNGTASFVLFQGRQFAVTCRHVKAAAINPKIVPDARYPTVALHIDRLVLNLSFFSATGFHIALETVDPARDEQEADVAIAELTGSYWELLSSKKGKTPIDLDNWREPKWSTVKQCMAAGYLDEHKKNKTVDGAQMVTAHMASVVAEVASPLARNKRIINLSSRLAEAHGYYFSGISDGALYAIEADGLALQLRFLATCESIGYHDSGDHGWQAPRLRRRWSCGHRRCGM